MKNQINKIEIATSSGLDRIDEIKSKIAATSFSPKAAKAQVYEVWQNIFEPEDS